MFSWGSPHPDVNSQKLRGGGGGNSAFWIERRATVRAVRRHFEDEGWAAFSRRLKKKNGIILTPKMCKKYCEADTITVNTVGRITGDRRYSAAFKTKVVRFVVGQHKEDEDREGGHTLGVTMKWIAQLDDVEGPKPGRTTVRRWVRAAGFKYKWRTKGIRLNKEHKLKRKAMKEECDEEKKGPTQWAVVIFTDSTLVERNHVAIPQNDGCYCLPHETPKPNTEFRHPKINTCMVVFPFLVS